MLCLERSRQIIGDENVQPHDDQAAGEPLVNGRNGERPKRSTGELYDSIWAAQLPTIMDERDSRAAAVAPVVARMVLMAMASFTNPNRDQVLGPAKTWQCFAAVATIAERADVSGRQVQRVLRALEREGYIELIYQARRPGRPRKNQEPGQGRPNTWCLRPDLWPPRALKNQTGVVAISRGDAEIRPVPAEVTSRPVNFSRNDTGTGREDPEKPTGVVTRTRSTYEPIEKKNPVNKPALADARANVTSEPDPILASTPTKDNHNASGFQMALPGQAAVGLSGLKQRATLAAPADALGEGQQIWSMARHELFRAGLDRALEQRLRNTGTAGYDTAEGVLMLDGDLVAEDLASGSPVMAAVATAARRQLTVKLVGGSGMQHAPDAPDKPSTSLDRGRMASAASAEQPAEAAERRARFEESLSGEDRALLQELERQRLAYEAGEVADVANTAAIGAPATAVEEASKSGRTAAAEITADERSGAPRRRRKKELVA